MGRVGSVTIFVGRVGSGKLDLGATLASPLYEGCFATI